MNRDFSNPAFDMSQFSQPRQDMSDQMTEQKKKKPWWTSLISEGSGLGGALAGGEAGAALGSVVPGLGTVIGGLLGAGIGGFTGGFGGSAAEQKVRDNKVDWGKATKNGVIEGVTSAGPLKLLKGGKAAYEALSAGEALAPSVENALSKSIFKDVGSKLFGKTGEALEETGGKLMNSQTNLTRAQMRQIGARAPELFTDMNSKYGLSKLDDIAEVASNVTGKNGVHSEGVRNVLFNGPGIDTGDINTELGRLMDTKAPLVTKNARQQVGTQVHQSIESMYSDQPLNALGNPGAALDASMDFRNQARLLRRGANPSGADKQLAEVYDGLANHIEKKLYSQPGVEEALPAVRDNMVKTYRNLASEASGAQAKAYNKLADEAGQMKSVADLRHAQKIWVQAGQIDEKTAEAAGNAAMKLGGRGNIRGKVIGAIGDATSPRLGSILGRTGTAMQEGSLPGAGLLGKLNNTGTRALAGDVLGGSGAMPPQAQPDMQDQAQNPQDLMGGNTQPTGDNQSLADSLLGRTNGGDVTSQLLGQPETSNGPSLQSLQQAVAEDIQATGGKNIDNLMQLAQLYGILDSNGAPASGQGAKLSTVQQKGVLAMQNAQSQVDQLEQLFNQGGGAQGRIGGQVSNLTSKVGFNSAASAYNDKRAGAAAIIARALGESGTMTDQDIQRAVSQIPSFSATPQEAAIKWRSIKQLLASIGQNTLSLPSTSDGGDLLSQLNGQ